VPKSLLGAAATVVATWWLILTSASLLSGQSPTPLFDGTASVLLVAAAGVLSGCVCVILWIYIDRRERRLGLVAQDVRGLVSSIGPVPVLLKPPPEAPSLPRFQAPDVPDDFYVRWLAHFDRTHPEHTALMRRMMRVMQAHRHLPASPVPGGHGDRTLLQHSLLCGYLMHDLARDFVYEGGRSKNTSRLILPLVDPNYKFNPGDPLCVIIGIAHDLGKIESYRYDEDGQIVGIRDEHDLTGARMIARMEECWKLPDSDRFAMMMALAHYHHPQDLPLSPDRKAIDDRTIALMELLTIADVQASAIEATGHRMTSAELAQKFTSIPQAHQLDPVDLFNQFLEQIHNKSRINNPERKDCLAWMTVVQGASRTLLLINEGNMAAAIGVALGIDPSLVVDDGRRILTITLLGELDRRGFLIQKMKIQSGEVVAYAPESALWQATFNARSVNGQKHLFGPVIVYVVDPAKLPDLASVKARAGDAVVVRGVFGDNRKLGARRSAEQQGPDDAARAEKETRPAPDMPAASANRTQDLATHAVVEQETTPRPGPAVSTQAALEANSERAPRTQTTKPADGEEFETIGADPTQAAAPPKSAQPRKGVREPSPPPPWKVPKAESGLAAGAPGDEQGDKAVAKPAQRGPARGAAPAAAVTSPAGEQPLVVASESAISSSLPPADERPSAREVTKAVVAAINRLGGGAAAYAKQKGAGYVFTLPCEILEQHSPEISWVKARHHILGLASRGEIGMQVLLPSEDTYEIEFTVPG
jgi:YD repeat-containing protein